MSLSKDLISQFVKATKDTTTVKKESTVYGTVVKYNEKTYVKIDGSDLLTPAETLSSVEEGERVSIMIKDHTATITGNYTAPSASSIKVDGMDADLKANTANIKNLVAKNAEIENLVATKASIEDLKAANAEIGTLKADYAEIETLVADKASIGDLEAVNADIKSLKADKADIAHLEANYATIGSLNAVYADVTRLEADKANIKDLEANYATIESLEANYATISQLESNYATIKQLDAANANITNLQTETANINTALIDKANVSDLAAANAVINDLKAGKADIGDLSAANAKIADLEAGKADISVLEANYATIKQLDATNANVTNLQTETANINKALIDKADVSDLNATNAKVNNLQATKANVTDLNATNANINTLTGDLAEITTLVNGNLTSDNIQSMVITGDKFTVEDGFIKNAMIDTVNASKINTGILNTNNVSIQSNDGSMVLQGNLQQFKDKNGKVRIQIGKDATGNFTFVLYDENGTGQLINQNGIQSSNAIADGLIVDSKVADNANIAGSKLDIDSVVTEVNNGTTSIKGTKIYLDDQKQALNVAFNNMSTTVKGNTNTIQSHTTSINTMNGKVTQLISDTTITKQDGTTTSLKDAYNATVDTVDSHSTKIGSLETNLATANNNISSVSSKQATLEQNLNGFKQTVSETYTTKAEFNDLEIGGTNLVLNSKREFSNNDYLVAFYTPSTPLVAGEQYTISLCVTPGSGVTSFNAYLSSGSYNNAALPVSGTSKQIITKTFIACYYEDKVPSANIGHAVIGIYRFPNNGTTTASTVHWIKIEKGNKATSWSPAPEDIDASIVAVDGKFVNYSTTSQMNSAINQKANEITSTVSETYATKTALNTVDGKFADYSTTSAMNSAINQKANEITSTVSNTYATKTALKATDDKFADYSTTSAMNSAINQKANEITSTVSETYATKTALNTVDGKFADYSTTSAMNSAINQKANEITSTVSETYATKTALNTVDGKFADYSTTSAMNSAINQKANEIASTVSETYATKAEFNNLSIGGTNLLIKSGNFKNDTGSWTNNEGTSVVTLDTSVMYRGYPTVKIVSDGGARYNDFIQLKPNTTYTYSVLAKASSDIVGDDQKPLHMWVNTTFDAAHLEIVIANNSSIGTKWTKAWITFRTPNDADTYYMKPFIYHIGNATVWLANAKVEEGNKATDWGPAPADIDASITAVDGKFANYSTTSQMNSAINQKANEITSTVSETYATKTALNTVDGKFANYSTTSQMNSAINQKSDSILSTVSSSYATKAEFNDLEIGGTNLIRNSKKEFSNNDYAIGIYGPSSPLVAGEQYTVSLCVTPASGVTYFGLYLSQGYAPNTALHVSGTKKQIVTSTFIASYYDDRPPSVNINNASIYLYRFPNNNTVTSNSTIHWIKIEKGNKATSWSPAPEDVDASITAVDNKFVNYSTTSQMNSAINQKANEITSTVSETYATKTALNTVDGKFANYSTTSAMNSAINQKSDSILSTVSSTYATKTALNTVDGKFANYSTTSQMNSAINQKSDSILSTVSNTYATKTALNTVDGKFANYSTTSAMNSAINQKSDAILSTVSSTYTTKADFNNLNIGGRNLLRNTKQTIEGSGYGLTQYAIADQSQIVAGDTYTISFDGMLTDSSQTSFYFNVYSEPYPQCIFIDGKATDGKYHHYTGTFKMPSNSSYTYIGVYSYPFANAKKCGIKNVKLEKGNKATDWTPAPEDIDSAISAVDGKFVNYSTTSQMNSAINQKANEITSTVSETYATKTALNTVDGKFANYSTTSAMNSAINQKSDAILSTVSSTYTTKADFNGLTIGGTNLLPKSGNFKGNTGLWISNDGPSVTLDSSVTYGGYSTIKIVGASGSMYNSWIQLKPNTTYTYSVLAKASSTISGNSTNPLHMWVSATFDTAHLETVIANSSSIGTKWTKAWVTFKTPNNGNVYYMKPFIYQIGSATVWLANAKVEEGNKATDWNPVPSDIDASIAAVDNKFTNYSTTSQMNSAINQKANEITSTVSETYATKTALNTVDGKFANYSTTSAMNTAINQKSDAILSTVSNTYTTKTDFNNLTIGGTNLLRNSKKEFTNNDYNIASYEPSSPLVAGEQYTVSLCVTPASGVSYFGPYLSGGYIGLTNLYVSGTKKQIITATFTANYASGREPSVNIGYATVAFYRFPNNGTVTGNSTVHWVKIEKGNKATSWSPAPEDVDASIATVDGKFANYSTTTQMNTAINQKAESITQSVSSTYATKTSLKSANDNITSLTNRMQSAESKLTKDSLTTTIGSYYTTSSDVNGLITSQGYATTSQLTQTTNSLTAKFSESGGYNLLRNGRALNGTNYWADNGGGLNVSASNPPTVDHKYFYTNLPAGMTYNGWVQLENNTHYIYSAKIFVPTSITGNKLEPLHYWCSSDQASSKNQATPVRSSHDGQTIPANKWVDVWVEYVTASSGNVWFKPFIYQSISNCRISVTDLMLCKGSIPCPYSPHPSEIYDGITQINKDGIKVYHNSIDSNSYTHMSSTGFYLKNKGTDIFKVDGNGLYIKGNGDFTGKVTANDGSIGGFTISNGKLVGTGGNGVGMSGNGNDWAFWAGSNTGGNAPFHVGHEGNLYATQAYITGTITGSTINAGTINGATINSDSFIGDMLAIDGIISAKSLQVQDIDNAKYPGAVTADFNLYVSTSGNDDSEIENGATFATFDGLLDKLPKNLNGHEVRIEMSTDITENVDFKGFFGGKIRLYMKGHTLYGYLVSRMGSARINVNSGYIGNAADTSNGWGKIHPSKGYAVSAYTTTVASVDQGAIGLYNIDVYGADNYLSGSTTKLGVAGQDWGTAYLNGVSYYGCDIGARANAGGRIHDVLSYNVCKKYGFYATTGGYITLAKSEHSGGKSKNYHEADAGKVIVASGATFASGEASVPGGSAPVAPTTKTITIKSTYGDTYRSSVYKNWKKDGTVRQGDYGYGDCNGCWFFGDAFSDLEGKTINKVTITITRQSGGSSSAVGLVVKSHGHSGRPSGAPTFRTTAGTLSLAPGKSGPLVITNSTILNEIKSGAVKGFGIQTTYDSAHYAVCSGSVTVKITYTE